MASLGLPSATSLMAAMTMTSWGDSPATIRSTVALTTTYAPVSERAKLLSTAKLHYLSTSA